MHAARTPEFSAGRSQMIELRTLGTLALHADDGREIERLLARPKRLALLAYLASSASSRFHSRDSLLGLFWPELTRDHARLALRQAVHVLRRELGPGVVVTRGASLIGLGEGRVWCDAVAFDQAVAAHDYPAALDLYQGDYLPGMSLPGCPAFERWLHRERERLRATACWCAWMAAEELEAAGAAPHAAYWGRRAVALSPDDEQGVRRLIALLDRLGDCVGALRAYESFARRVAIDLGLEPSAETRALVHTIRTRMQPVPATATAALESRAN
jgi:DNA-binding SARP family transcriptional activator